MDLLVVGAGEMGRWFAGAVETEDTAFVDADPAAAERAAAATGGRAVDLEGDERAAVVCVAVPIPAVADALAAHADRAREAVVDVTGVMGPAVAAMREHAPDRGRLSLHPLFAPQRAPGRIAAVEDAGAPAVTALREVLTDRGNDVFDTTPAEHDRAMATVQARAHTAILAYGLAREAVPEAFHTPVSRALTDLVDQVTEGTPHVYADMQSAFDGADDVAAAARRIADADDETFATLYREAREARDPCQPNASGGDGRREPNGDPPDAGTDPDSDPDRGDAGGGP